jgi:hypothetical protein
VNLPELKSPFRNAKVIGTGVDPKVYHASKGDMPRGDKARIMSRSELVKFMACPEEWMEGIPQNTSKALSYGSLKDCLVTTPALFNQLYVMEPEQCTATKSMKCVKRGEAAAGDMIPWNPNCAEAEEWKESQNRQGMSVLSKKTMAAADRSMQRLRNDPFISQLLDCSERQVMVMADYHDRATGLDVPVKALIDLVPDKDHPLFGKSIADYKTARDISRRGWKKAVFNHGYHIQGALYLDIYTAATGEDRVEFLHAISKNIEPWQPARRALWSEALEIGRRAYLSMLEFYCQCLQRNEWPGPDDLYGPHEIKPAHGFRPVEPETYWVGADGVTPAFPEPEQPETDNTSEMPS